MRAGRDCPLDYRLDAAAFSGEPVLQCDSLYVVGGLYGNLQALQALQRRLAAEPGARVVFNGDMHWFDGNPELFARLEQQLQPYLRLRGNVETELGRADSSAGCGCAYPDSVDQQHVDWSNAIHARLQAAVAQLPGMAARLAALPATALVQVGDQRVAISHGDEQSLAGWQCSHQALQQSARQQALGDWCRRHTVSVLACSHTCTPAALAETDWAVINNGAAGMPNFANGHYGLVSRIALTPHPAALYRARIGELLIEAIALNYDRDAMLADFDRQWPTGSPAALAYRQRLLQGTATPLAQALLGGFSLCQTLCALDSAL